MYHYLNKVEDIKISNTSFSNHEFYKGNTIDFYINMMMKKLII